MGKKQHSQQSINNGEKKVVCICMGMACIASSNTNALLHSNGIKIYVAQRKLAVAAYKSNELHPA